MRGEYLRAAYPLTWPENQKRTVSHRRRYVKFKVTLGRARDDLMREPGLLGAKDITVSSNVPTRRDGLPYCGAREPNDPGVAVYFDREVGDSYPRKRVPFVVACDSYDKVTQNIRAVGVTIEALRAIQRHGATEMLEQAFTGFAALPPAHRDDPWWETLGVAKTADAETINRAFRELAALHHPDKGGDVQIFSKISAAYTESKEVLR